MWKLTVRYNLKDLYDQNYIFLSIKRNSAFELNGCYFHDYTWDKFTINISVTVFVRGTVKQDEVFKSGIKKINESINILNYMVDNTIEFYMKRNNYQVEKCSDVISFVNSLDFSNSRNTNKIKKINDLISKLPTNDKKTFQICVNYLTRGMQIEALEMYEESFLCYFKGIELLANTFVDEYNADIKDAIKNKCINALKEITESIYFEPFGEEEHKELINKFKKVIVNGMDSKRKFKILISCYIEYVDIAGDLNDVINGIVATRNKMVAHGNVLSDINNLKKVNRNTFKILYNIIGLYFFNLELIKITVKLRKNKIKFRLSLTTNRYL